MATAVERRPPAGIAPERETGADDSVPCQRECRTTLFVTGGVRRQTDHESYSRRGPDRGPSGRELRTATLDHCSRR